MITRRYLAAAALAIAAAVAAARNPPAANRTTPWIAGRNASYVSLPRIMQEYTHEADAFTQGLVFGADGALYESDGLYRHSRVRRVELGTGRTLASTKNANEHFGEGLAAIGDKLYQLTWREGAMHEYDAKTLRRLSTKAQPFRGEGWGLAYDEATGLAYGTDGTHRVHVLRPAHDWVAVKVLRVTDARLGGMLIEGLNELEMDALRRAHRRRHGGRARLGRPVAAARPAVEPRQAAAAPLRDERPRLPARGRSPAVTRYRQAVGLDVRYRSGGVGPGAGPRPEPLRPVPVKSQLAAC